MKQITELKLKDFEEQFDINALLKDKPKIVIVATVCRYCGELHPFIFAGEFLYYAMTYVSWHQYRTCECGIEVAVYCGHGNVIFNPHNIEFKDGFE